jgi:hypothetical protein
MITPAFYYEPVGPFFFKVETLTSTGPSKHGFTPTVPRVDGGVFKRGMPIVMGLEIFNTETGPHVTNTLAVTHDDAATGYACGFNSNGDITIDLIATGKPGTHLINLYPAIYKGKDRVPWNYQTPFLTYAQEFPARFAGYRLSAYRLAIEVSP